MDSADLDGGHKLLEIRMAMLGPIFCIHKDSGEISLLVCAADVSELQFSVPLICNNLNGRKFSCYLYVCFYLAYVVFVWLFQ